MTLGAAQKAFLTAAERAAVIEVVLEGYDGSQHPASSTA
jgi:hypothetical protein